MKQAHISEKEENWLLEQEDHILPSRPVTLLYFSTHGDSFPKTTFGDSLKPLQFTRGSRLSFVVLDSDSHKLLVACVCC